MSNQPSHAAMRAAQEVSAMLIQGGLRISEKAAERMAAIIDAEMRAEYRRSKDMPAQPEPASEPWRYFRSTLNKADMARLSGDRVEVKLFSPNAEWRNDFGYDVQWLEKHLAEGGLEEITAEEAETQTNDER